MNLVAGGAALAWCPRPFMTRVPVKGTLSALIDTLTRTDTDDAAHRALPDTTATAYDALGGCRDAACVNR